MALPTVDEPAALEGGLTRKDLPITEKSATTEKPATTGEPAKPGEGLITEELSKPGEGPITEEPATVEESLIVTWDGPDDPLNPLNWTNRQKWTNLLIVSAQATIAPIASTFLAVADLAIAEDFHITNIYLPTLPVAIYLLGQGIGPLYVAPLSEMYGRRVVYLVAFTIFMLLNAGCALAPNMASLIILRFMCGMAGSSGALGAGTVSDMFEPERRGRAQATYALGPQAGPVLGGVIGGFLLEATGTWRWLLWIMTIASGITSLLTLALFRESYGPFLCRQKAKVLRMESGNNAYSVDTDSDVRPRDLFLHSILRPLRLLLTAPICTILSLYTSVIVGIFYLQLTTNPLLYGPTESFGLFSYKWQHGLTGLSYLSGGVGLMWATIIGITSLNRCHAWMTARYGDGESRPEFRMPLLQLGTILAPLGLVVFAWSAHEETHWIIPLLGVAIFCCGIQIAFISIQVYLVDAFEPYSASALAGSALSKAVVGCVFTTIGFKLFVTLGYGWGATLLAFLCIAALPIPTLIYVHGPRLRKAQFI